MAFPPVVPDAAGPLAPRGAPETWEPASAGPAPRRLPSPWTGIGRHLLLLALTIASVWSVGTDGWPGQGWKFALALLSILFCHEMGHYLACRWYRVDATLPYFIPSPWIPAGPVWMPISFIGTFGAVIRIRGRIPHRRALFDIGVAGPLAGFVVILVVLALGVTDGTWVPAPPPGAPPGAEGLTLGEPLLLRLAERGLAPQPGMIYMIGPLGLAAWVGMLVTALNLLPVGQLDGGHVVYALLPRHAKLVTRIGLAATLGLLWFRPFWLLWTVLLWTLGRRPHPPTMDDTQPVGIGRALVGVIAAAVLVLCFTPSPILVTWPDFAEAFTGLVADATGWLTSR